MTGRVLLLNAESKEINRGGGGVTCDEPNCIAVSSEINDNNMKVPL